MDWWKLIEPWDKALLLVLNAAAIGGLVLEHRRGTRAQELAEEAHKLASEAHRWERERAERETLRANEEEARRKWCDEMRRRVEASEYPLEIPNDVPTEWVLWGVSEHYFRRIRNPYGEWELFGVK